MPTGVLETLGSPPDNYDKKYFDRTVASLNRILRRINSSLGSTTDSSGGTTGPAGPPGPPGPTGADGPAGPQGSSAATTGSFFGGYGPPSDVIGNNGDWYLDLSAIVLYGPKYFSWSSSPSVTINSDSAFQLLAGEEKQKDFSSDIEEVLSLESSNPDITFDHNDIEEMTCIFPSPPVTENDLDELRSLVAAAESNPRPAQISDWKQWTPSVSASGSMTVSSVVINDAEYLTEGPMVSFKLYFSCTLGGSADSFVYASLPVLLSGSLSCVTAYAVPAGKTTFQSTFARTDSVHGLMIRNIGDNTLFPLGAAIFILEGRYRIS